METQNNEWQPLLYNLELFGGKNAARKQARRNTHLDNDGVTKQIEGTGSTTFNSKLEKQLKNAIRQGNGRSSRER